MKFKSDIEVQAGLKDSSGSAGTSGKILSSTGTGVAWVDDNPGISGTGTTNYLSKFTGTTTLGNSLLFDNGTNVGIGTTSPTAKLNVETNTTPLRLNRTGGATALIGLDINGVNRGFIGATTTSAFESYSTAASPLLSILNTGNVGIGTTSPSYKLDISADNNRARLLGTTGYVLLDLQNNASSFYIGRERSTGGAIIAGSAAYSGVINLQGNYPLYLGTNGVIRTTITGGGDVGIGTTAPSTKLDVVGTANTFASIGTTGASSGRALLFQDKKVTATKYNWLIGAQYNIDNAFEITPSTAIGGSTYSTPSVTILQSGNVGIGTTSPAVKLHLLASSENEVRVQESTNNAFVSLYQQATTSYLIAGRTGSTPTQDLSIYTGGGEKMRILSNGNVGIGTSTPQRKLDVISGANNFVSVGISQMSVGQWAGIGFGYAEGSNNLYRKSAIVFERTDLTSNNAQGKVHILNGPQGNANSATLSDSKLTIAENGNVGIGTTSPGAKLDVNGDALINQLTIGQGPVVGQGNTALGKGALGSMVGGKANIAVGSNANSDNDVTGLTVIGVDLNVNPAGSALTQNSLVIGQYNALNYSTQYPHIYAPDKVNCPNGNTTTDVIAVDYSIYTAIFMEYSIFNSAGDQFRAGTYTAAFKGTGTVIEDDNQTVVYSGTTLAATFTTSVTGNVVTIQLRNQDSDTYDIRVTARLLMR